MSGLFRRKGNRDEAAPTDGTTPIALTPFRQTVRVRGQVTKIRQRPARGLPSLVVTISDESGRVTAIWSGRRSIGGIGLGRDIVIEGVAAPSPDGPTFLNPSYLLLPPPKG
ncbi:MAG: hypothetical protein F2934_09900 [Actinobacteria bacterium]|uniref:Unannotated protein n=1 Tax=freshwater metagenome TaxID=449393 RepID=A0A6J7UKN7_9ZZZZ|nr:hypothetical protein [Actinomycetota bacterium]MSY12297.1 hypothetical protein [Actinomycetota bacterium]MSZ03350.1 hypothetical protein [Actinomycetota bacterium]MTB07425.1 hypothetical protein [Actinomycetota bacterium]